MAFDLGGFPTPCCPYCEEPVNGRFVMFGGEPLHLVCFDRLNNDLETHENDSRLDEVLVT